MGNTANGFDSQKSLLANLRLAEAELKHKPKYRTSLSVIVLGLLLPLMGYLAYAYGYQTPTSETKMPQTHENEIAHQQSPASIPDESDIVLVNASGYVHSKKHATVSADTTGRLTDIYVQEGEKVKSGQLIAKIDSSVLEAQLSLAEAQHEKAKLNYQQSLLEVDEASVNLTRIEKLNREDFISKEQLETSRFTLAHLNARLEARLGEIAVAEESVNIQKKQLERAYIRAPFSGVVTELAAEVGEIVSPISAGGGFTRTGICTIIDVGDLEVEVQISENYIRKVARGQKAVISASFAPEEEISGTVSYVMPHANKETASFTVKIALNDRSSMLSPNVRVDVALLDSTTEEETSRR